MAKRSGYGTRKAGKAKGKPGHGSKGGKKGKC